MNLRDSLVRRTVSKSANAASPDGSAAGRRAIGKIKVLHIISDLSIGGAEMMLYKMLAQTDLSRFEPVVLSLVDRGVLRRRIEKLGIPVHTPKIRPNLPSPLAFVRLVRLLNRLRPDLVHGWMYHGCLVAQLTKCLLPRTCSFWSIHYANDSFSSEKFLTAALIRCCAPLSRWADQLVFVSRASHLQHGRFGYDLRRSCVIPNGINTSEFLPSAESRASLRSELGLPQDAFLIGMMGRYHPMKDHANFIRAAGLIAGKYPKANFLRIGQGVDYQNRQLAGFIEDSRLTARMHLRGQRDDIPRIAAALDIFSLSSAYGESCPNVIGEAMSCEVPCVVTAVGGAAQIVGDTGRVVPPKDPGALAKAWEELITMDAADRRALGRAARQRVMERFTLDSVISKYETAYLVLVAEKSIQHPSRVAGQLAEIPRLSPNLDDSAAQ